MRSCTRALYFFFSLPFSLLSVLFLHTAQAVAEQDLWLAATPRPVGALHFRAKYGDLSATWTTHRARLAPHSQAIASAGNYAAILGYNQYGNRSARCSGTPPSSASSGGLAAQKTTAASRPKPLQAIFAVHDGSVCGERQ